MPMIVVTESANNGDVISAMALSHSQGKRWERRSITDTNKTYQWNEQKYSGKNDRIFKNESWARWNGNNVVVAMWISSELLIANVGDSRAYLYRNFQMKQLTEDHTLVQELLKSGEISEESQKPPSTKYCSAVFRITLNVQIDFVEWV